MAGRINIENQEESNTTKKAPSQKVNDIGGGDKPAVKAGREGERGVRRTSSIVKSSGGKGRTL